MRKRAPIFSPEGISINDKLQALHEIYKLYRVYTRSAEVTVTWTEELSRGPRFIKELFKKTRRLTGAYNVHPLSSDATFGPSQVIFVDDDTDGDPTIGTVAFYISEKKGYEAFNFDRASMKDLQRVDIIVEAAMAHAKRWKGLKDIYSTTEYSAMVKNKISREDRDTPH
jgi:hypothetical protein